MRKTYILLVWSCLVLGSGNLLLGQPLSFRYLGKDQGLNSLASWNCAIDHHGFLWIGSTDGLVRFNGKETSYYSRETFPEMPADQIGFVFCDSHNRIWVCFDKGLVRIDEDRVFTRQTILPDRPDLKANYCFEDNDDQIYVWTPDGVFSSENGEEKWQSQPWLDSLIAGRSFRDIRRFDRDRYIIPFPSSGVMLVNLKEKKQELFIPVKGVTCVARFDDKSILISKKDGFNLWYVSLLQPDHPRPLRMPSSFHLNNLHEQINYMVRAADHNVYMTTIGSGLVSLDSSLSHYTLYTHDPVDPSTIFNNSLRYITADSTGNLVICSLDGVNYTNVHNTAVEYINYLRLDNGEIMDERVISIAEDPFKKLWICTYDNVFIHDSVRNKTAPIVIPPSAHLHAEKLSPMYVECDQDGNLWVALRHEGIAIFYPTGKFRKLLSAKDYPGFGNSITDPRVIREGHDGYVYVGTEKGLYRISHEGFTLDSFADHPALAPLKHERIVDIFMVPNGIWVSSSPGGAAWHYSFTEKKLKVYNEKNGLPTNRIYGIAGDHQGNIYLGSYNGLSIISPNDSIRILTKGQGLISPRIESIETADDGSVWMTNNYNLLKYDPASGNFSKLGGKQGLSKINFAIMGSVKLSSGKIAFGATKGFIIVDPTTITFGEDSLNVFVVYKDAEGREIELVPGKKLNFTYKQQNIRFSFAVNDLMIADQVLFRYQLSKKEPGPWSNPSLNANVDFNLDPGSYTLKVQAFDGHKWYEPVAPVYFRITPPWWRQWWFVTLIMAALVAGIWMYFFGRIQKVRRELSVARQISDLESKALRAQMNPHFVFNSLNAIQECIVTGKIDEAYTYLSKFSRLLRLVLEHSDRSEVSLHEEVEVLSLYVSLEKLRFKDDMEYIFTMDENLDDEEITISPMLIQPHLENAIWHGLRHKEGEKILRLSIAEKTDDYLDVRIEDNGIGRIRAEELRQIRLGENKHKSKGKQLSGNRIELLQKAYPLTTMKITDLYDDSGVATGTRVQMMIPILKKKIST